MVRNVSKHSVGVSSIIVAVLTLASRFVGLLRIRIFASFFGAGQTLDVYYASFRIPDFIMGILIVGTLSIAALPVIAKYTLTNMAVARKLVSNLLTVTFVAIAVVCAIAALFAPWLVRFVVPGFSGEAMAEVVLLTRLILLAQVLLALGNVVASALNAVKRFFWAGFAPITYNVGLIAGVVWLYPAYGVAGLGYGVILGALAHLVVQLFDLVGSGFTLRPHFEWSVGLKEVLRLYIPRLFTIDLSQISLLLASFFGSFLASGSIAVYSLGFDIQAVPVGVFAFAVATASFPHLAEYFAKRDTVQFVRLLRQSVVRILFFMMPIAVVMLLLRAQIVRILYGAGNFTWNDTRATLAVLGVLVFSLIGQSLIPLFSRALLARHNTWAPVISNAVAICVAVLVTVLSVSRYGINGVAAGYGAGVSVHAILLYTMLRRAIATTADEAGVLAVEEKNLFVQIWKVLTASALLAVATYGGLYLVEPLVGTHTWVGLVLQTMCSVGLGGVVYMLSSYALRLPDSYGMLQAVSGLVLSCGKKLKLIQ